MSVRLRTRLRALLGIVGLIAMSLALEAGQRWH
jgi:hypothetical protein